MLIALACLESSQRFVYLPQTISIVAPYPLIRYSLTQSFQFLWIPHAVDSLNIALPHLKCHHTMDVISVMYENARSPIDFDRVGDRRR